MHLALGATNCITFTPYPGLHAIPSWAMHAPVGHADLVAGLWKRFLAIKLRGLRVLRLRTSRVRRIPAELLVK